MTTLLGRETHSTDGQLSAEIAPPRLALRMVQLDGSVQTLPLPAGKCTVGSSERCHIHLSAGQVRPLHCLIVHGTAETTVTRWAPGALLNGHDFTSAALQLGDCLTIGEVQLRLVSWEEEPPTESQDNIRPAVEPRTVAPTVGETRLERTISAASSLDADRLVCQLWTANYSARQRCRQLIAALRRVRSDAALFDQRLVALEAEHRQSLADRDYQVGELHDELEQLRASATVAQQRLTEQTATCERLQAAFEQLQEERGQLLTAQSEQQQRQQAWQQQLADRDRRIELLQADYNQTCQALQSVEQGAFDQLDAYKKLETELEQLRTERDQLAGQQPEREQQVRELEESLAERDRQISEFSEQLAAADNQRKQLEEEFEREVAERVAAAQNYETESAELRSRYEQLSEEHDSSNRRQQELQQNLADHQRRIDELCADLNTVLQQREELQQSLAEQTATCENLQAELAEHLANDEQRAELQQQLLERQQRIELLEVDVRSAQVELNQSVERAARLEEERRCAEQRITAIQEELESKESQLASLGDVESTLRDGREERDKLAGDLNAAKQERDQLRQQAENATAEINASHQRFEALEAEKTELAQRVQQQTQQVDQLSLELEETQGRLAEGQTQMDRLNQEYQQTLDELEAARACLRSTEQASQSRSLDANVDANTDGASRADVRSSDEPTSTPADHAVENRHETSTEPTEEDKFAEAALAHLRELSVWAEKDAASSPPAEHQDADEAPPAEQFEPTSFIDQYSHLFGEGNAQAQQQHEPSSSALVYPTTDDIPHEPPAGKSDDEDLEAYMANLMQRIRGESITEEVVAPRRTVDDASTSSVAIADPVATVDAIAERFVSDSGASSEPEKLAPMDLDELKQTSHKPPLRANLSAMRALANSSARQAIAKHRNRRHLEVALSKFIIAAIAAGTAVFMLLHAKTYLSVSFIGGCLAAFLGVASGIKLLGVFLEAVRDGSPNKETPAEISLDPQPLPIDGNTESTGDAG